MTLPSSVDLLTATIQDLQSYMSNGLIASAELTQAYLNNIESNNDQGLGLHSIIETNTQAIVKAHSLDRERPRNIRSPLHGVPIIVKDNIATEGMETTCGATALIGMKAPGDAAVVTRLKEAGAIILGKANMSQYSNYFGMGNNQGWSYRGGQSLNPYENKTYEEGNRTGASSSGSAVGVASGMAAGALATETNGSLLHPALRNQVFGLKPTTVLTPRTGVFPISMSLDSVGTMGKSAYDCAVLLDAMVGKCEGKEAEGHINKPYARFTKLPYATFVGKRIGVARELLNANISENEAFAFKEALAKMQRLGATIIDPVHVPSIDHYKCGKALENDDLTCYADMKIDIDHYLSGLNGERPKSLAELIKYNAEHPDTEFAPSAPGQHHFIAALQSKGQDAAEYRRAKEENYQLCEVEGIHGVIDKYHLDALVSPRYLWYPGFIGSPGAAVPLGLLDDGEPHGLVFYAKKWEEDKLLALMAAFENSFPKRLVPERLRAGKTSA